MRCATKLPVEAVLGLVLGPRDAAPAEAALGAVSVPGGAIGRPVAEAPRKPSGPILVAAAAPLGTPHPLAKLLRKAA